MVDIIDDLWVCCDCIMMIANGDLPTGSDADVEDFQEAFDIACEREAPYQWVAGSEENEFSWRHCDCCHSSLGGSRHEAYLINHGDV